MKASCLFAALCLLMLVGCTGDRTPKVPKEQAAKTLDKWLAEVGLPDPAKGFDKGQQARVTITDAYSYSHSPEFSYATLRLDGFQYRENGEIKSFTGEGGLTLHRQPDNRWVIQRLTLKSDIGAHQTDFVPPQIIEVEP